MSAGALVAPRTLSRAFGISTYRASRGAPATYRPITSGGDCVECFARQHETHGACREGDGKRAPARTRREIPGNADSAETALLLCREHGELWRERDEADQRRPAHAGRRH